MTASRRAQLAAQLAATQARIANACAAAGRPAHDVSLLAVSKTFPFSDVLDLLSLGQRDMGESRHQEAVGKAAQATAQGADVRWHFLGQLQRNKAGAVAAYATCVQSVDRDELVAPLARGAAQRGFPLEVLIQVNLDEEVNPARGGIAPAGVLGLAASIAAAKELRLRGVMSVAPRNADPREAFDRLRVVAERLRTEHPDATVVSAGMSGDLEAAIAEGSTLVRVGTALFGHRAPALG